MAEAPRSVAVVVGASGGIGHALAEALVETRAYDAVVALSRERPATWRDDRTRLWAPADILDEDSLSAAAAWVTGIGAPARIIVATGLLAGQGLQPEKSMRALDPSDLAKAFAVNAIGPALVAKHLLPLTPRDRPSLFAALSARVGSIGDNRLGGWYGYRASKAALNMMIRSLAIEHRRSRPLGVCVALHPGTVATALSAPFQASARPGSRLTPAESAQALIRVMDGLGPDDSGNFYAWDGAPIPW